MQFWLVFDKSELFYMYAFLSCMSVGNSVGGNAAENSREEIPASMVLDKEKTEKIVKELRESSSSTEEALEKVKKNCALSENRQEYWDYAIARSRIETILHFESFKEPVAVVAPKAHYKALWARWIEEYEAAKIAKSLSTRDALIVVSGALIGGILVASVFLRYARGSTP